METDTINLDEEEKIGNKRYKDSIDNLEYSFKNLFNSGRGKEKLIKKFDIKLNEENKDMLESMKGYIDVSEVRFTNKLKNHPVCLSSKGDISLEMEKVINAMPTDETVKAEAVLEINENHPIKDKLIDLYNNNKEELEKYTKILYSEARLIEGLQIDNPSEISSLICDIISK